MRYLLVVCALLASCTPSSEPGDTTTAADTPEDTIDDASDDAEVPDSANADTEDTAEADTATEDAAEDAVDDTGEDATPVPAYVRTYPPTADYAAPEGTRWARSIVHLHSAHSHDACDDMPRLENGEYNEACLQSLRDALCEVQIDVAWLTDHPSHMTEVDAWADLLLHDADLDTLILEDDLPVANRLQCADGHEVVVRVGSESSGLMPLGLRGHVADTQPVRSQILGDYTAEAAAQMKASGALIWVAHTELRTSEDLLEIGVEGMEIYQLHAGIDPRIRGDALGVDPSRPLNELSRMLVGRSTAEPDLAFLSVVEPNRPSLNTWGEVLRERAAVGTAGTDAHENSLPMQASDGERIDSYRRMMAWFSNYLLIDGPLTWRSAEAALAAGRVAIVFDVFGDANGMDFSLASDTARFEMGATVDWEEGLTLRGNVPVPVGPSGIAAQIRTVVWRFDEGGWTEVAELSSGAFSHPLTAPGIYRVEVFTTSEHLLPYLGELAEYAPREVPWIMTNAWRVGLD